MHLSACVYGEAELVTALPSLRIILHTRNESHHTTSTNQRKRPHLKLLKPYQNLKVSFSHSNHIGLQSNRVLVGSKQKSLGRQKAFEKHAFSSPFLLDSPPGRTPGSALEALVGELADQACTKCQVATVPQKAQALVSLPRHHMWIRTLCRSWLPTVTRSSCTPCPHVLATTRRKPGKGIQEKAVEISKKSQIWTILRSG